MKIIKNFAQKECSSCRQKEIKTASLSDGNVVVPFGQSLVSRSEVVENVAKLIEKNSVPLANALMTDRINNWQTKNATVALRKIIDIATDMPKPPMEIEEIN